MERYDYQRQMDRMRGQLEEMRGRLEQMSKEAPIRARETMTQMGEMAQERPALTTGLGILGLLGVGVLALAIFSPRTFRRFTDRFIERLGF